MSHDISFALRSLGLDYLFLGIPEKAIVYYVAMVEITREVGDRRAEISAMNGLALAQAVRVRFPRMPVVLCTGFSTSAQNAVRQGFIVLQKPFDLITLEQGLREAVRTSERQGAPGRSARLDSRPSATRV